MSTDNEIDPAERRLGEHLELLRDRPASPERLAEHVIRSMRWQRAVRSPLLAVALLAESALDAIRLLLGGRRQ